MTFATETAKRILKTYPDYSKSPPEYLAAIVSLLSTYPPSVQNRLADIRDGIPAKCKYLPSVSDIVELAKTYDAFKPTHTTYHKFDFDPETGEVMDVDRRKQIVLDALGYNPQASRRAEPPAFKVGPQVHGDHRDLQTPAAPASDELKRLMWEGSEFTS